MFPDSRNVLEPNCSRCPELAACRNRISWGTGPLDADVMVVGEAPGAGAPDADLWQGGNWTGMAYTTRHSGRKIRRVFDELGYDAYFTNAVKCFPEGDDGSNREPRAEELANCFEHLQTEIEQVGPSVVVTTGKHATKLLFDFESIRMNGFLERVLSPVECERLGVTALPLLHPSYENVWRKRLGYDRPEYIAAIGSELSALV
ncbi:uracil-DNA glycosylase [Haladaptatus sp. AB643]|uniref:uracil-DNA glycosylase n=1 Tax=Haladaptatus sp. AB643 TaxID=2934174 RepID=UPI00209C3AA4|nr:uracil-DNA glycosylase [Haladaptatus sp. AB643]MCO8244601.1 uracil-DNA glycosylase [Haladaptatus sp. AB643]